jgi:acyl-[acyl-carrier-protein]-phospholipid O-acyltransferase/long-chain-fatty-acid--[acyl-carrier-protein] ligase
MLGLSVLCWGASLLIPRTGEAAPHLKVDPNIMRSTAGLLRDLWADSRLWRGGLMVSWFWLVGAVVLSLLPSLVRTTLSGDETVATALIAVFAVSVAVGSGLASWMASGRIVLLPVPVAAILMAAFGLDLALAAMSAAPAIPPLTALEFLGTGTGLRVALDLAGLAAAGGLFIVPAFAAVQAWAPVERRARVIAAVNVISAGFMAGGAGVIALLQKGGVGVPMLLVGLAGANLLAGLVIFKTLPTSPFRDLLSILFRAFYRLEVKGMENLEKAGPNAIVALNHVSFLDGALALSILDREPVSRWTTASRSAGGRSPSFA